MAPSQKSQSSKLVQIQNWLLSTSGFLRHVVRLKTKARAYHIYLPFVYFCIKVYIHITKRGSLVHPVSEFTWGLPDPNGDQRRLNERDELLKTFFKGNRIYQTLSIWFGTQFNQPNPKLVPLQGIFGT